MNPKPKSTNPPSSIRKRTKSSTKGLERVRFQNVKLQPLLANYQRLLYTLIAFADISVIFYLIVYLQSRIWQALVPPGIILGLLLLAPIIYIMATRGRTILSGFLLVVGMAIAYGANEISWTGLLPFHIVGGLLMILIGGSLVLPRQRWLWVTGGIFYALLLGWVNISPPILRIPQELLPPLLPYTIGTNFLLVIALVFQFFMQSRLSSLRNRFMMTMVLLVFITATIVGTVINIFMIQKSQTQLQNQLDTVISLKVEEIDHWISDLKSSLRMVMPSTSELIIINALITKTSPSDFLSYQSVYADTQAKYLRLIASTGNYKEVYLLDLEKRVILSTDAKNEGLIRAEVNDFEHDRADIYVTPLYFSPQTGHPMLVVEIPIHNNSRQTIAFLAGQVNLDYMNRLMNEKIGLGANGETYLISADRRLLSNTLSPSHQLGEKVSNSLAPNPVGGTEIYTNYKNVLVTGAYRWLEPLQAAIVGEQAQTELLKSTMMGLWSTIGVTFLSVLVAVGIGWYVTKNILSPLNYLANTAEQMAAGNLDLSVERIPIQELGALANAFNSMAAQLRGMASGLEQRVSERLRTLEKRSDQFRAAAEIAKDVTSIRNLNGLLNQAVKLIQERFGYYHTGIFLIDEGGNYAVLKAATGEAGRQMLQRGHRLRVGQVGFVGHVAMSGVLRVSGEVSSDQDYVPNPLLPDTKSEVAIPLKVETKMLGLLDIQSTIPNDFDEDVLNALEIIATQIAISIQSALLLDDMNRAITNLEQAYSLLTQDSWKGIQHKVSLADMGGEKPLDTSKPNNQRPLGYRYRNLSIEPIFNQAGTVHAVHSSVAEDHPLSRSDKKEGTKLVMPIRIRGQEIGWIEAEFDQVEQASNAATTFEDIANRMALLLENARLIQEAKRLASREQRINLISSQVRNSIDLDTILRNTVREFGKAFGAKQTFVQLGMVEER